VNSSVLSQDLKVAKVLADLVFIQSLFQRVGAATGKERDENAVLAGIVDADGRQFLVG